MGSTSVTGKGVGESHGVYKPEHNCGCSGCIHNDEVPPPEVIKRGCYVRSRVGGVVSTKTGNITNIHVC
jgi:hypothetical protein